MARNSSENSGCLWLIVGLIGLFFVFIVVPYAITGFGPVSLIYPTLMISIVAAFLGIVTHTIFKDGQKMVFYLAFILLMICHLSKSSDLKPIVTNEFNKGNINLALEKRNQHLQETGWTMFGQWIHSDGGNQCKCLYLPIPTTSKTQKARDANARQNQNNSEQSAEYSRANSP